MSQSKSQFMQLRAQDMVTMYDHEFTKKKAESTGMQLVSDIFEKGEVEPIKVFSNLVRLKAVIDAAEKGFRERLSLPAADSWNGVTFTPKNGAESLNYDEDDVCRSLSEQLKARQELVKLATKSKDTIYDKDGVEVPQVTSKFNKPSITVTF